MRAITKEQEDFLDECSNGTWKLNTESGLVDINGGFYCANRNLPNFLGIDFGIISGDFDCSFNKLVSLEGAPIEVMGNFHCYNNKLVSLEGSPQKVGGTFSCGNNQLVSLEGSPQKVGGTFSCSHNKLVSLEGAPIKVMVNFHCYNNKLVSLEGISNIILGNLYCDPINIRNRTIYKFTGDIYFYINGDFTELKKYMEKFINNLAPKIYLKNMIRIS